MKRTLARNIGLLGIVGLLMVGIVSPASAATTINGHTVVTDSQGRIVSWLPGQGQAYDAVTTLAWNYLLNQVPNDPSTGRPAYLSQSYLNPDTQAMAGWPNNPAGMHAMLIESAIQYYKYSGNKAVLGLAQVVANQNLTSGMTLPTDDWANVPYASGDAGSLTYRGASYGNSTGVGDGAGYLEPDKVGELGFALLLLYESTGNTAYRDAAVNAANALARHVRTGSSTQSPWPFRVNALTGAIREQYSAHVISAIELFDELGRLGLGATDTYRTARATAWTWMMAYPMKNNAWSGYFEDVAVQSDTSNTNQLNAMAVARYLLLHPEKDPDWLVHVRGLISWVESTFGVAEYGATTIREQQAFMHAMGSHTSRYAAVNALLFAKTGDVAAKEKAYRAFNWATYMARSSGVVIDGPTVNNQWFTDGYGDYIRHFLAGMFAVPQWAPTGQTHVLDSSSVVTNVVYGAGQLSYTTFDSAGTETIKTAAVPTAVTAGGKALPVRSDLLAEGWTYDPSQGLLQVRHNSAGSIVVTMGGTPVNLLPTVSLTAPTGGGSFVAPASFSLSAIAADSDGTVSRVEFYQNGGLLGQDTIAPYGFAVSGLAAGSYTYLAKAYDDKGGSTTSSPVSITVSTPGSGQVTGVDVGKVGVAGSTTINSGTATLKGSGVDIWGTADSFHFADRPLTGDGSITARVVSQQATNAWAKAGVMIRDGLGAGARHAFVAVTPTKGLAFHTRTATAGVTSYASGGAQTAPYWLRLTRTGNKLTAYAAADGKAWSSIGSAVVSLGSTAYVGLAVTSHNNAVLGTVVFDNVDISGGAAIDTTPPVISTVVSSAVNQNGATITWTTNEPATSGVDYGLTAAYGSSTALNTTLETLHTQVVAGLAAGSTYHYRVRSADAAGNSATSADLTFATPAAAGGAPPLALDTQVVTHASAASASIVSPALTTSGPNELIVAFASSDGPATSASSFATVSGGGLTWTLRKRVNAQGGTSEVWTAPAPARLANVAITATRAAGAYRSSLVVGAFTGADLSRVGAAAGASAVSGAPNVSLTTTRPGSWVWAVGNDWDGAVARTVGTGQVRVDEYLTPEGDTFWVQRQAAVSSASGTVVTISDTAPTKDRWNLAAFEILPAG